MFSSINYISTLAEAAKNAAQPHCCGVPNIKMHQPLQTPANKPSLIGAGMVLDPV